LDILLLDATGVHSMKPAITARGRMTRLAGTQKRRAKFPVRNQLQISFAYMRHDAASWINREQDGSSELPTRHRQWLDEGDQAARHDRPGERTSNGQG